MYKTKTFTLALYIERSLMLTSSAFWAVVSRSWVIGGWLQYNTVARFQSPNVIQWTFDPGIWDHHIGSKRRALYLRRTETSTAPLWKPRNSLTATL